MTHHTMIEGSYHRATSPSEELLIPLISRQMCNKCNCQLMLFFSVGRGWWWLVGILDFFYQWASKWSALDVCLWGWGRVGVFHWGWSILDNCIKCFTERWICEINNINTVTSSMKVMHMNHGLDGKLVLWIQSKNKHLINYKYFI